MRTVSTDRIFDPEESGRVEYLQAAARDSADRESLRVAFTVCDELSMSKGGPHFEAEFEEAMWRAGYTSESQDVEGYFPGDLSDLHVVLPSMEFVCPDLYDAHSEMFSGWGESVAPPEYPVRLPFTDDPSASSTDVVGLCEQLGSLEALDIDTYMDLLQGAVGEDVRPSRLHSQLMRQCPPSVRRALPH